MTKGQTNGHIGLGGLRDLLGRYDARDTVVSGGASGGRRETQGEISNSTDTLHSLATLRRSENGRQDKGGVSSVRTWPLYYVVLRDSSTTPSCLERQLSRVAAVMPRMSVVQMAPSGSRSSLAPEVCS